FEVLLHNGPDRSLSGIRHQHLDDRSALDRFFDFKEGLAWLPAVFERSIPVALELAGLADNDVEPVVAQVERLGWALDTIPNDGDDFVFEDLARFGHGKLFARDDLFFHAAKINQCHNLCSIIRWPGSAEPVALSCHTPGWLFTLSFA